MIQRILDGATSLGVLAVCVLILAQAVRSFTPPATAGSPALATLAAGDRLEPIAGLDLATTPRTLVMALQSSCHFCSESMAFYQELARRKSASVRLVVVAPDDTATATAYVARNNFTPDAVISSGLSAIRVDGTPTLLLINKSGVIERVWMGKLSPAHEKEVLAEVTR